MSSTQTGQVSALVDGLAGGNVEIVDLTQPLTESTPVIKLPPPFANTPGLTARRSATTTIAAPPGPGTR